MQPINGRLLVRVAEGYQHVTIRSDKQHQNANNEGVVVGVPGDLNPYLRKLFNDNTSESVPISPNKWIGVKVRWIKFAEQDTIFEGADPRNGEKCRLAAIKYEDVVLIEQDQEAA